MRAYWRAVILLWNSYRKSGTFGRLHIAIRFLTCPFLRILPHVPLNAGRLLEIGGGHGVFAHLAADRGVSAVVVDPDLRKIFSVGRRSAVSFVGAFDDCVVGKFEAIAILDVLYAIPIAEWDAILGRIHTRLTPGGVLLLKEMDPSSWKQRWNQFQEAVSQRFLGITLAATFNYEPREALVGRLLRNGFSRVEVVKVDRGYPHPHLLYLGWK